MCEAPQLIGYFPPASETIKGRVRLTQHDIAALDPLPYKQTSADASAVAYENLPEIEDSHQGLAHVCDHVMTPRRTFEAVDHWHYIRTELSLTVGDGGDFSTLENAFYWLGDKQIAHNSRVTLSLLAGDHLVDNVAWHHRDSSKIRIVGQAASQPSISDMTGDIASDEAIIRSAFPSRILLTGDGSFGLHLCNGLEFVKDVAFISTARYSLVLGGFKPNYQSSCDHASISFNNVAFFGGVWGIIGVNADIRNQTSMFFAHMRGDTSTGAGGPLLLRNSDLISNLTTNVFAAYVPGSRYFVTATNSNADISNSAHGVGMGTVVDASNNTTVNLLGGVFSLGGNLAQVNTDSTVHSSNVSIDDFDTTKVSTPFDVFPGYQVGVFQNLINIGHEGSVTARNLEVLNSQMDRFLFCDCGKFNGFGMQMSNSTTTNSTQGLGRNATGNVKVGIAITGHSGNTTMVTDTAGTTVLNGSSGHTSSPAQGTSTATATVL